jgi:hypothetical protein
MVPQPRKPTGKSAVHSTTWQGAALALGLALAIPLNPGPASAQALNTDSKQPETLRGMVVNAFTHEPIGHALVISPDNRFATMTDDQGRFEFAFSEAKVRFTSGPLPHPSPYRPMQLAARKPGFRPEHENEPNVPIPPSQATVTISLVPEALIVGRIVLPVSDYFNRMPVQLFRRARHGGGERWEIYKTVRSRADGSFRFADLPRGDYQLATQESLDRDPSTFDPQGQLFGYPPVYYPAALDLASAQIIRLVPGVTFQANISPVRREYHQVKIGVTNATSFVQTEVWAHGHPSPGYSLRFVAEDSAIEGTLPDGSYTIRATTYGNQVAAGAATLTVSGGPAVAGPIMLLPNPSIAVNVQMEFQNEPPQNVINVSENVNGVVRTFTSSPRRPNYLYIQLLPTEAFAGIPEAQISPPAGPEDESLVIKNVFPGRYRARATTSIGYVSALKLGREDLLHSSFQIESGSAPPSIEVHLRDDGASVEGTVEGVKPESSSGGTMNGQGQVPTVYFFPSPDSTGQFRLAWIGPHGNFQLQQLPPGTYRVLALDYQDVELEYASAEDLTPYDSEMQTIEVAPEQKVKFQLSLVQRTP